MLGQVIEDPGLSPRIYSDCPSVLSRSQVAGFGIAHLGGTAKLEIYQNEDEVSTI